VLVWGSGLTGPGQGDEDPDGLQDQVRSGALEGRQDHQVILVLHKLHEVVITHWMERDRQRDRQRDREGERQTER